MENNCAERVKHFVILSWLSPDLLQGNTSNALSLPLGDRGPDLSHSSHLGRASRTVFMHTSKTGSE